MKFCPTCGTPLMGQRHTGRSSIGINVSKLSLNSCHRPADEDIRSVPFKILILSHWTFSRMTGLRFSLHTNHPWCQSHPRLMHRSKCIKEVVTAGRSHSTYRASHSVIWRLLIATAAFVPGYVVSPNSSTKRLKISTATECISVALSPHRDRRSSWWREPTVSQPLSQVRPGEESRTCVLLHLWCVRPQYLGGKWRGRSDSTHQRSRNQPTWLWKSQNEEIWRERRDRRAVCFGCWMKTRWTV